jgi:hypothetical protein
MFWPPVGSATRSNRHCALPHLIAPQGAQEGRHRHRCALPVPMVPATPLPPREGAPSIASLLLVPCGDAGAPLRPPSSWEVALPPRAGLLGLPLPLCGLSSLLARLRNVLPQGSCVKVRPRCAHEEDNHRGLPPAKAVERARQASVLADCGRRPWTCRGTGRRTRVPDEALAVADGPCGGNVPPRPSCVAALPGEVERSCTGRAVCRGSGRRGRLPMAGEASGVGRLHRS